MTIVADHYSFVVGVDTHARTHTYAIITSNGRLVDQQEFPTHPAGITRALDWINRRINSDHNTLLSVEGTGSYGAQLTTTATEQGYRVVEAPAPTRHQQGKTDALDAQRAARNVLPVESDRLTDHRRHNDQRDVLAALTVARDHLQTHRTATINTLTAHLRVHNLGMDARTALTTAQIRTIAAWRARDEAPTTAALRQIAIDYARDITILDEKLATNHTTLDRLTTHQAPQLRAITGIGPITAAVILAAWSHPGRVRNEAAFAMLAGVAPIPASSGNTHRHRLNRGGDRQLNRCLHTIVNTRLSHHDPDTLTYYERRRHEGKTDKEIRRCLKRFIARKIYRTLTTNHLDTT